MFDQDSIQDYITFWEGKIWPLGQLISSSGCISCFILGVVYQHISNIKTCLIQRVMCFIAYNFFLCFHGEPLQPPCKSTSPSILTSLMQPCTNHQQMKSGCSTDPISYSLKVGGIVKHDNNTLQQWRVAC
jgi:hypothetical protein